MESVKSAECVMGMSEIHFMNKCIVSGAVTEGECSVDGIVRSIMTRWKLVLHIFIEIKKAGEGGGF
jgi:hypothetical protein